MQHKLAPSLNHKQRQFHRLLPVLNQLSQQIESDNYKVGNLPYTQGLSGHSTQTSSAVMAQHLGAILSDILGGSCTRVFSGSIFGSCRLVFSGDSGNLPSSI